MVFVKALTSVIALRLIAYVVWPCVAKADYAWLRSTRWGLWYLLAVEKAVAFQRARLAAFVFDWVLTTNHRRLGVLYFAFTAVSGFTGLILATIIRLELAYPGQLILANNAEQYLTLISLHGIIMVFFFVIPVLFGAFGNFLLPTQLGIRDVAFPRLNSFMFWITPSGFVSLLHILLFDRSYALTYWVNYSELRLRLRRRFSVVELPQATMHLEGVAETALASRILSTDAQRRDSLVYLQQRYAPDLYSFDYEEPLSGLKTPGLELTRFRGVYSNLQEWYSSFQGAADLLTEECRLVGATLSASFSKQLTFILFYYKSGCPFFGLHTLLAKLIGFLLFFIPVLLRILWKLIVFQLYAMKNITHPDDWHQRRCANLPTIVLGFFEWLRNHGRRFVMTCAGLGYSYLGQSTLKFNTPYAMKEPTMYPIEGFFSLKFNFPKASSLYDSAESLDTPVSTRVASLSNELAKERTQDSTHDLWADWRELRLEREVWRSLDMLSLGRQALVFRRKYYSELFEPTSVTSKISTWLPNHLIPGWAFITPYSSRLRFTALGKVDIALVVVFMASLGSVFSSINYVITYRYIGAPILKSRRELRSFFIDALLVGSRMMILANPALLIGILLLLSDRHLGTSVFDFSGGGDTVLFQHLFWFFGHPEVYIIIIPCFGLMNSLLPHYLRKRLSGRTSLQFSMYTIAFMGFAVWGHHMYMVGLANSVRTLYSTMTVMISVPASTKVLHWCVTLVQATMVLDVGLLFLLNFMYFFVLGGLSGMFVAHIGFDTLFHDTFYVIGHFHVMLAGAAVSCIFAGFYFYFAAIFGVKFSRFFAYLHYFFYTCGQLLTLIPMFWLGYAGMPRRIMDYPSAFGGWHSVVTSGHFLTVLSLVFFLFMLLDSFYEGRAATSRTRGVSRLNNRLAFYAYEGRKLRFFQARSLLLNRSTSAGVMSQPALFKACAHLEGVHVEYVFSMK